MLTTRRTLVAGAAALASAPLGAARAQSRWQFAMPYQDTNFHTRNNRWFAERGGRWIVPLPHLRVV